MMRVKGSMRCVISHQMLFTTHTGLSKIFTMFW